MCPGWTTMWSIRRRGMQRGLWSGLGKYIGLRGLMSEWTINGGEAAETEAFSCKKGDTSNAVEEVVNTELIYA